MVFDQVAEHPSKWATTRSVSEKLGDTTEVLCRCVRRSATPASPPALTTTEREELTRLHRDNFELKRANEILKKAAAFFAQAEIDRRAQ